MNECLIHKTKLRRSLDGVRWCPDCMKYRQEVGLISRAYQIAEDEPAWWAEPIGLDVTEREPR